MDARTVPLRTLALTLAAALACALPAPAEEATGVIYNVEIIVFRDTSAQGGAENWSAEADARSVAGDESASGSLQIGRFVGLLPPSAYQLNELENRMRTSGSYLPVAHAAWSQTASAWGTRAGFALARLGIDVPGLTGNVFLERGQFLHLGLSLTYAMATPPDGLGAAPGTAFTLNETRRVRFYERNYYDHPAFGVIALVAPAQGARPPGR
ncbi:MAG: CsiV family protein [Steroidobacteraceae bacterium]